MNIRLPSTKALAALEATVRLGKATLAAQELGITQAAISHRLSDLEEGLDRKLFVRNGRKLRATPEAEALAEAARGSRRILESAIEEIQRKPAPRSLTISMLPALASKWLAPHLADMLKEVRDTDLRVTASRDFVDFERDGVDAALRYGLGKWPNLRCLHLTNEMVTPVMSPDLAARLDITAPDALARLTLLQCDNPEGWGDWFQLSDLQPGPEPTTLFFDEDATMIEAAVAGNGVALGRSALVAHDIRSGRLVAPFAHNLTSQFGYWFVQDAATPDTVSTSEFLEWTRANLTRDAEVLLSHD
ncbi:LysR substrate-binding domain-containing protein [Actibacterium sp. 188UL27-1]|uniref:LysR substrate-binding domain-containing protein n=1 Tax=Actibacterium sp. 188UL27-1 TaxID=2786961 RepID=UPI00195C062C|nr:LysR substrate-binding domain-containing protein [Actibacterium sp. 188UL27-1]MBM7068584.1 LysR family transcriptional regulator [Actibacterium sp. 188UL27-1]